MRKVTLCFLVKEGEICLAMKKRGFGKGKWNGVGGKLEENETIIEGALREMEEEIGVKASEKDLESKGSIKFFFPDKPENNQHVHIYFVHNWEGDPVESEEMRPKWYKNEEVPYERMWVDDQHWLPKVIEGKRIEAECYFSDGGDGIEKFDLREI